MEPEEAFTRPPLYEYEQVLVREDLLNFLEHLLIEHAHLSPIAFKEKVALEGAIRTVDTLITWLDNKKPRDFGGML